MKSKYQNDQKSNFGNEFSLFAVEALTIAIELAAEDSGKFYTVDSAGGAYEITLPAPTQGIRYDFVVKEDTPTGAVTIKATGALIYGRFLEGEVEKYGASHILNINKALEICENKSYTDFVYYEQIK